MHGDTHRHIIFSFGVVSQPSLHKDGTIVKCDLVAAKSAVCQPLTPRDKILVHPLPDTFPSVELENFSPIFFALDGM